MSDLSIIPLEDGFETQLAQDWNGAVGTVYVLDTPSYTPTTTNTYIVVNPGKTNMQIAEITDYDSTANTLTVSNVTLLKGLGINSTAPASSHATGSKVIISDNYQFWADIQTAINSKLDDTGGTMTGLLQFSGTTHAGIKLLSLTTVQRDALSASNGMIIYNSTTGELNQYIGGAWSAVAAGSTQADASTTVAGKVEIATSAETIAGTDTGGTGAQTVPHPSDVAKNTQSGTFTYGVDVGGDDTYVVALTPTLTVYTTGQTLSMKPTTANTGACTIDFGPGVKNIKMIDGTDPITGDILAGGVYDFKYDGTNMVLQPQTIKTTNVQTFTSSNTWTKPAGAKSVSVIVVGAGGGGGSGGLRNDNTERGGTGGGGGAVTLGNFDASVLGSTVAITVGTGGTGGASQGTASTAGNDGTNGGLSSFGNLIIAGGGGKGLGGVAGANSAGGGGGGSLTSASGATGGTPAVAGNGISGQGVTVTNSATYAGEYGGGGGGFNGSASGTAGSGSIFGAGGGGAGGGSAGSGTDVGGAGGTVGSYTTGGGGTAGSAGSAGGAGSPNTTLLKGYGGAGGGGGSCNGSAPSGAGGAGGLPGGGGGGSGGSENGQSTGVGGAGANGQVVVITYL